MEYLTIANIIGLCAALVNIYAFFSIADSKIKKILAINSIFFGIHFYMIGAFVACACSIVSGLRFYMALNIKNRKQWIYFALFYVLAGLIEVNNFSGIFALPIIASILGTYSVFNLSGIRMRLCFICGTMCWLVYHSSFLNFSLIMMESIILLGHITVMWRLSRRPTPALQN